MSEQPASRARAQGASFMRGLSRALVGAWLVVACGSDEAEPKRRSENESPTRVVDAGRPRRDSGAPDASKPALDAAVDTAEPAATNVPPNYARPSFCERERADAIRDVFCREQPPPVRNLRELQDLIEVNPLPRGEDEATTLVTSLSPYSIVNVVVFLGHSTSLGGRLVSPINPRALLFGPDNIMAFQRGVQKIELATLDRESGDFNFYLVSFTQACNEREGGCSAGDLYTARIERDWAEVQLDDDEDLKNSPLDCRQCHQRGRPQRELLMRELKAPWTHFFEPDPEGAPEVELPRPRGIDLVRDFLSAKGDEPYAGIPTDVVRHTIGLVLQNLVSSDQPLLFDAPKIEEERWPWDADAGYPSAPVRSPTWDRAYAAFQRGEQLALPHFDARPTDPDKQQRLSQAYRRYRAGELPADELPDLSDVFPDDPALRAEIGLETKPGSSPAEVLVQACGSCHNDVLDQTVSRARFNIDLSRLDQAELALAIERIELPSGAPGVMPPPEFRQLSKQALPTLREYLRNNVRSKDDDALLKRAAQLGMAGPPDTP